MKLNVVMFTRKFFRTFFLAPLALLLLLTASPAQKESAAPRAGFVVNTLNDDTTDDAFCTLREAINAANNTGGSNTNCGALSSADDTITFSVSGTIALASTLPSILSGQGTLTIDGTGQNITISGNAAVRVFVLDDPSANLTLQKVTIADGRAFGSEFGGGIVNVGTLTVTNSTFSDNNVGYDPFGSGGIVFGGGIYNEGTLTVINSTFSGNNTYGNGDGPGTFGYGAGIYNAGTASVINSTFFGNEIGAGFGAGIGNGGTLTVINSTFFDNSGGLSGGIDNVGTLTVINSTFFNNLGGASIRNDFGTVAMRNTIVANPTNQPTANCSGTITDGGGNLQFGGFVANSCGGTITTGDPKLVGHANNGGPTETMALQVGSAAIDAGTDFTTLNGAIDSSVTTVTVTDGTSIPASVGFLIQIDSEQMSVTSKSTNTLTVVRGANGTSQASHNNGAAVNPAFDQRGTGFPRKVGSAADIGAYELLSFPTAGCPVTISIGSATITFACVTQAGQTTFDGNDPASNGALPNGYTLCPTCPSYDITTTATYTAPVTVCLAVPASINQSTYSTLKLMHGESGQLVDRTTSHFTDGGGQRWVCGSVNALSPFGLATGQTPTTANGTVTGRIVDSNGNAIEGAVIRMSGTQNRKTITDSQGNYNFFEVETNGFYTVTPSRADFGFVPTSRSFSQVGQRTEAAFTGDALAETANPLDTAEFFVRQQYVDVLGRDPDESGFNYWSNQILGCGGNAACMHARRRDVAAAFFVEDEFQLTGSFLYGLYKAGLGRRPFYQEFANDRPLVVGGPNLEQARQAFAQDFVGRPAFVSRYQSQVTAETFVDALLENVRQTSGLDLSAQRGNIIGNYELGTSVNESRSLALRHVIEQAAFQQREYNAAFVLTEYFAYLRRDPDARGYAFWLEVLNNREPGNYRGMVCSFITSEEYQNRFSRIVSRSNGECGN